MSAYLADFLIVVAVLFPAPRNLPEERGYRAQTSEEFQKTFNELHPQGWRLQRIKGYEKDGSSRFDSEWNKPEKPPRFWCQHGINSNAYDTQSAQLKDQGYVEVLKSTWKLKGEDQFWVVWELR